MRLSWVALRLGKVLSQDETIYSRLKLVHKVKYTPFAISFLVRIIVHPFP